MSLEGGFQGRTNKLVDSCYSFWQGACFDVVADHCREGGGDASPSFDRRALERYVLSCAQQETGGLRDKPGKRRDQYHSCYALSGLSIAQHGEGGCAQDPAARVAATHPVYNVRLERVEAARAHFGELAGAFPVTVPSTTGT